MSIFKEEKEMREDLKKSQTILDTLPKTFSPLRVEPHVNAAKGIYSFGVLL